MKEDLKGLTTPIADVILSEQQNFAIVLPITGLKEFDLFFFRVLRRYPLHRIYDSELSEIAAGKTVEANFLGTTGIGSGDDILEVDKEFPFRFLHFGIGIRPSEIGIYKVCPADTIQTAFGYKVPPKVGDKFDFIPGYLSDYDMPTVATETIVYYNLSCHYGFKNWAGRAIRPSLRIFGAGYDALQITDDNFINGMISGRIPCRYLTVGGLRVFTWVVPDAWAPPRRVSANVIAEVMRR